MSQSLPSKNKNSFNQVRVNGKIRAREIRVIGVDGAQLGIMSLNDGLALARQYGVDLVEIAPNANPPVCRLVDFGKYRYELSKKQKDSKKHQHASKLKELQLSATISEHDFKIKVSHAIDFLCDDSKVKLILKFRGREMAHQEIGFNIINNFIKELAPYGQPENQPKLIGKGITVIITPLPKNKRAKPTSETTAESQKTSQTNPETKPIKPDTVINTDSAESNTLSNRPFENLVLPSEEKTEPQ